MPVASPSMPSIKFITLQSATSQATVKASPKGPRKSIPPNGFVNTSIPTPKGTGTIAATSWPNSFSIGETPQMSSMIPRSVISVAPISTPMSGRSTSGAKGTASTTRWASTVILMERSRGNPASTAATNARYTAIPPRRGTGERWMCRPPGCASTPRRVAIHTTSGVKADATTKPIPPATRTREIVMSSAPGGASLPFGGRLHDPRLREQLAHRLVSVDPPDRLPEQPRDRDDGRLRGPLLRGDRDTVRHHKLADRRAEDAGDRGSRQDCVRAARIDLPDAPAHEGLRPHHDRAPRIDDVVDQDRRAAVHLADHVDHVGDLVGAVAPLVDDRERGLEVLGKLPGPLDAADVRGHHDDVLEPEAPEVIAQDHPAGQVVQRDVEEAPHLPRMEVEGEDAVRSRGGEQVGDQFRGDRLPGLDLPVLTGVAEVWDHRGDARRAGATDRVDDHEKLHEGLARGGAGRLDDEHIFSANALLDPNPDLPVGVSKDVDRPQREIEGGGDAMGEIRIARAAEDPDPRVRHRRRPRTRITRAGTPTTTARGGTSFVTTAPAPVIASRPIRTGATSIESLPMYAPFPMVVRCFRRSMP